MQQWRVILAAGLLALVALSAGAVDTTTTKPALVNPATQQYWLGLTVENIPPTMAKLLKLADGQGLLVDRIMPDSPAQQAGLLKGDLLITFNGTPLTNHIQLADCSRPALVGKALQVTPIQIELIRAGERSSLTITPAPRPEAFVVQGNARAFQPITTTNPTGSDVVNRVALPNGGTLDVGPGYRVDLTADPAVKRELVRQLRSGQPILISQQTDAQGNVRRTITFNNQTYTVTKDKLSSIPESIRPLAEQMLEHASPTDNSEQNLEETIRQQQVQLEKLKRELEEARKLRRATTQPK
ncbi:MAG: PDZ domain-containing protein [Phycisphaerae bacterium]